MMMNLRWKPLLAHLYLSSQFTVRKMHMFSALFCPGQVSGWKDVDVRSTSSLKHPLHTLTAFLAQNENVHVWRREHAHVCLSVFISVFLFCLDGSVLKLILPGLCSTWKHNLIFTVTLDSPSTDYLKRKKKHTGELHCETQRGSSVNMVTVCWIMNETCIEPLQLNTLYWQFLSMDLYHEANTTAKSHKKYFF